MATSFFNYDPFSSFDFSGSGGNPMMQPVPILGQQGVPSVNPSASRQAEIGGTGSYSGDSAAREANIGGTGSYAGDSAARQSGLSPYDFFNFNPSINLPEPPPAEVNVPLTDENDPGFFEKFFDPGGFGYEYLGPRLGDNIGQFFGEQLYGTGIDVDGNPTGFPIDRPSLLGDIATLPGNAIRALDFVAGPPVRAIPEVADYITGESGVAAQAEAEDSKNAEEAAKASQELSRLMENVEPNSPQANFLAQKAKGDLTPKQIADANAYAKSIGTTFDPTLGFSRTPFLESQSDQPQITRNQLEKLVPPGPIAPMGEAQTRARLAQRFGFNSPVTVNQAIANNPNLVMGTDAQGRMRTFASPAARQQNLANAQIAFNQASQDRQARIGGTGSFEGDSAARNARVGSRDKRPGETQTERDTRIAQSRTVGADRGGEMSFNDARKFVPKGQKETSSSYNQRIKAYQAQQNSRLNKLKENLEELRVTGQELNNQRTAAIISNYAKNQPQKYSEVLADAQRMYEDGRIKDRDGLAVYIVDQMGGDLSELTNEVDGFNPGQLNTKDRQAYDYAINNPDDPRSQQILDKLGVK